jgi:hypothetical protein
MDIKSILDQHPPGLHTLVRILAAVWSRESLQAASITVAAACTVDESMDS